VLGAAFEAPMDCCAYATASFRDSKPPTPTIYPRPGGGAGRSGVPRSGDGIGYKNIPLWAAACAAAFLCLEVKMVSVPRVEKIFVFGAKVL